MADLDAKTKVPLSLVGTCLLVVIGCTVWLNSTFSDIKNQIGLLTYQIKNLGERLDNLTIDRWTLSDQRTYNDQLKALNPNLVIPRIKDR